MDESPKYPITIFFRDTEKWVEDEKYENEFDMLVGLEFAVTEEKEDAWAIRAIDSLGREVSLKIEAIELKRFEVIDPGYDNNSKHNKVYSHG